MSLPARITALLTSLTTNQLRAMPPAERQRLTDECRRVLRIAEPDRPQPKSGVLADLNDGKGRM